MKKKEDKKKDIEALRQDLGQSQNLFVTGYEKLRVNQDFELRKVVRGAGAKYRVVESHGLALINPLVEEADAGILKVRSDLVGRVIGRTVVDHD